MSFYDNATKQLIESGKSSDEAKIEIRDKVLEKTSDFIANASSKDMPKEEIFSYISQKTGVPIDVLNMEDPKSEIDLALEKDEILTSKKDLIDIKANKAIDNVNNNTNMSDEEKDIALKTINLQKLEKTKEAEEDSKDKWIKENKAAPIVSDGQEPKQEFNLYQQVKDFENEVTDVFTENPAVKLALNYTKRIGSAIGQTGEELINVAFNTDFDFYSNISERAREEGKRINQSIDPNNKLMLNPTQATDLFASIIIPLKVTDPKKMLMLEGMLGYTTEFSNSGDFAEAVKQGSFQASAAGAGKLLVDGFINLISKRGTDGALNYLWDKHSLELREASGLGRNATKEEVIASIEQDWLKVMQGKESNENKVRAMIDRLGGTGAAYKLASQETAETVSEATIRQPKTARVEDLRGEVKSGDIEAGAEALAKEVGLDKIATSQRIDEAIIKRNMDDLTADRFKSFFTEKLRKGNIKSLYGDFSNALKSKYTQEINIDSQLLNNVASDLKKRAELTKGLTSAEANLAERLSQPMTIDNLLQIKIGVSDMARSATKGTAKTNASILMGKINTVLKDTLSPEELKLFKELDTEYARRMSIVGKKDLNQIGVKLMSMANGKQTTEAVIKELDRLNLGETSFKELEKIIGTANIKKIELGIVKNMLDGKIDDVSYDVISKSLENIGFVTKEGKEFKNIIDNMNKVFSADNFTNLNKKILSAEKDTVSALTANIAEKMKYSASSWFFTTLKRKFFVTKEAIEFRNLKEISDILSGKPLQTRGITLNGKTISNDEVREIARDSIVQAYKAQIKAIKPEATINDAEVEEVVNQSMLGLQSKYGGKPTSPKQGESVGGLNRLFGTKKEAEEFTKNTTIDRFGIKPSDRINTSNTTQGSRNWYESLTNTQKKKVEQMVEQRRDRTGGYNLTDLYEEQLTKVTKSNSGNVSYKNVSDSLFGTKQSPSTKEGKLGMSSKYGEKPTSGGGANTKESKAKLNEFMFDIANPKVEINKDYVNNMFDVLKKEGDLSYGFSSAKKKAYNELYTILNNLSKMDGKMKASGVDKVKKALEEYLKHK